jgi:two-component system cell cycle sensor histidine kinase/response regulator CckA
MATLLVVDDEATVLELVSRTLLEAGYRIVPAGNGHEAWAYLQRHEGEIDLVLADVVMPHMTGTELAARIAGRWPELPLILMSGYSTHDLMTRGLELSHGHLLTKPFQPGQLLGLVRQLIPA